MHWVDLYFKWRLIGEIVGLILTGIVVVVWIVMAIKEGRRWK
jgi:hypothetical protein